MSFAVDKLGELVQFMGRFEANPRTFDPTAFLKVHEDLIRTYKAIESNRQECEELDQKLVHELQGVVEESSILRRETLQIHASVFWLKAGGAAGCHRASIEAARLRSRRTKEDVRYFLGESFFRVIDENEPIPPLVRLELLATIARHVFEEPGIDPPWGDDTPYKKLIELDKASFFIHLVRRWQSNGRVDLTAQKNRKENEIYHQDYFIELGHQSPVSGKILERMGYLKIPPFWERLMRAFRRLTSGVVEVFHSIPAGWTRTTLFFLVGLLAITIAVYTGIRIHRSNSAMLEWLDSYGTQAEATVDSGGGAH